MAYNTQWDDNPRRTAGGYRTQSSIDLAQPVSQENRTLFVSLCTGRWS